MALPTEYEYVDDGDGGGGGDYTPPPSYQSGDWAKIADLAGDVTGYVSASMASVYSGGAANLNGTYPVTDVTPTVITLGDPEDVNPAWATLTGATAYASPTLSTEGEAWAGWFVVDGDIDTLVLNVTAPQGMYLVTKKGKDRPYSATTLVQAQPVGTDGEPTGATVTTNVTVRGDGKDKSPKGVTAEFALPAPGRWRVRQRRTSPKVDTDDTIVDELVWRDCYGTRLITVPHFGDVTTVLVRTYATSQATAQKERKFSCEVTRRLLERNPDDTFGPALVPSTNAAHIICHMALDPYIGGRTIEELDVPQLFDTVAEVVDYFGIPEVGTFNYTFDQDNVSFEEMAQTVAQCVFCTGYRQGSVLRLFFERERPDSTLLFNHRSKTPGSENRTVRFGYMNDNDGVEFDYVSPVDGSKLTIYLPADQSATKPKKLEVIGVQSERHGTLHAKRAFNKIKYQHTTTEFEALGEATQLVLTERIEVADNTRFDTIDGHVVSQDGLTLELSQPFVPVDGVSYAMHLQLPTGKVQVIDVAPGTDKWHVVLQEAPEAALVIGDEIWADVAYQIAGDDGKRDSAFLLTEKGVYNADPGTLPLQAINYDHRYYQDDLIYKA